MMTSAMSCSPGNDEEDAELLLQKLSECDDDIVFILNWRLNPEEVTRARARKYSYETICSYGRTSFMTQLRSFHDASGVYHIYRKNQANKLQDK
jgi:hypothetical protein